MKTSAKIMLPVILTALLGAGCTTADVLERAGSAIAEHKDAQSSWTELGDGIERLDYFFSANNNRKMLIYRIPKGTMQWRFEYNANPQTVEAWKKRLSTDGIVLNGSYFDEKFAPTGLLVSGKKKIGTQVLDPKRSAVVSVAPEPTIIDTSKGKMPPGAALIEAAQTYPLLVANGESSIKSDSGLKSRRSFVGTDTSGNVYVGVVPEEEVTLYSLAQTLAGLGISWSTVANFDGGQSTAFAADIGSHHETIESIVPIPIVLIGEVKAN